MPYNGIKEMEISNEDLSAFYEGRLKIDLLQNQYLLLKQNGNILSTKYKYDKEKGLVQVFPKDLNSKILGTISGRNVNQDLLIDLLYSDIPLISISGLAGSGKTFLSTAHALQELQREKYSRIVIIRNDVTVPGVRELGALPGDKDEKLRESVAYVGDIITDYYFDNLLKTNKITIAYLGTMRSRSLSDSYILCNEAQNLTTELVKMIISRVGENSRLIFDFDYSQIDRKSFEKNNGMIAMNEALAGHRLFGAVELKEVERSEVAKLASLIN